MKRTIFPKVDHCPLMMAEGVVYKQTRSWYGADNRTLSMNIIRCRDGKRHPTVVWFTGGAWEEVSKNVHVPQMVYLAEAGYTVAAVEYRNALMAPFPAQIEDCKAAIRFLRANADDWGVDPEHIACMGESAGGHLAALLGTTSGTGKFDTGENAEYSSDVCCVIDWYGPSELTSQIAFSEDTYTPEAYLVRLAEPGGEERVKEASPVTHIHAGTPPFLIIHGTNDNTVPFSQSELLHDRLEQAGCEVTLLAVENAVHGDASFDGREIRGEILAFLNKHMQSIF